MLKRFLLCAAIILLLSSGAFATVGNVRCIPIGSSTNISQAEDFSIDALNMVKRVGGHSKAEGGNVVTVDHSQGTQAAGTKAIQRETGNLTQHASAVGWCGYTKILQDASVEALQGQMVKSGWHRPGTQEQGQSLTVGLDNGIHKSGGIGHAVGEQGFVGEQFQMIVSPNAVSLASQTVDVDQYASVNGSPGSTVDVKNSVDVKMGQWQNLSLSPTPPKR